MTAVPSDEVVKLAPNVEVGKLAQVLGIQKKKFLTAINKLDPGDAEIGSFSKEDEKLVEDVSTIIELRIRSHQYIRPSSKQWNDSEAIGCIKDTLQKHAVFDHRKYLNCAEYVCKIFSSKRWSRLNMSTTVMQYVLTHARTFGDPNKTIFQIETSTDEVQKLNLDNIQLELSNQSSRNAILRQTEELISELKNEYDENKFQALNNRITSFVLIIQRRLIKQIGIEYCLPFQKLTVYLLIDAYLNSDDEKTKHNIWHTCLQHVEWYKMQLPGLFFKVAELYDIKAGELWDLLSNVKSKNTAYSLITLSAEYYSKYQVSMADPSQNQRWFPYCRIFNSEYHRNLSNSANAGICAILNNLIEKKKDVVIEPAYKFTCPDNADEVNKWAAIKGDELFKKIQK